MHNIEILYDNAISLLKQLISIPSFSREEVQTANSIVTFLDKHGIENFKIGNNVCARNKFFDADKPTLLLNSHHDTVKPNKLYSIDPFTPIEKDGKLYGLGSNDAGGSLVSLITTFLYFYPLSNLNYNLLFVASAEEEISGINGIELALKNLPTINCAIVGEPTLMNLAVAERGLLVLDCNAKGIAGHAARDEGDNAIYKAITDIQWFSNYKFSKPSSLLGPVKMSVTVMETENKAHNVVPPECKYVVDIRVNENYTFEEIISTIKEHILSEIKPRSLRLKSTFIEQQHPLVQAGLSLGRTAYGSPTTSDKALMPFPALKIGPGDSARSHIANEFIYTDEIRLGIQLYIDLIKKMVN